MTTTIIIPLSRQEYLEELFHCLEVLECDREDTNLLAIVDGDINLFVEARNKTTLSKFNQRLCVQYQPENKQKLRQFDIPARRRRIADIHEQAKMHLWDTDYVFLLEDDTIFNTTALAQLRQDYLMYPYAGLISGVQVGRHGIGHIGAFRVNNVYDPTEITSILPEEGIVPVDATGIYCTLTKLENYMNHTFKPLQNNDAGPDIDWGLGLRMEGLINYIDFDVKTIHKTRDKRISMSNTEIVQVQLKKTEKGKWIQHVNP